MTASAGERKASVPFLAVTALGVVYGDIGTSPLYALRECFFGSHAVPPSYDNVLARDDLFRTAGRSCRRARCPGRGMAAWLATFGRRGLKATFACAPTLH